MNSSIVLLFLLCGLSIAQFDENFPQKMHRKIMKKMKKIFPGIDRFDEDNGMDGMDGRAMFIMRGPFRGKMINGERMEKRGRGRERLPPFLVGAPEEIQEEVKQVMVDRNLTREEKDEKITEILKNTGLDIQESFANFKADMDACRAEMEKQHNEAVSKLSQEAQIADEMLRALYQKRDMSQADRITRMTELFDELGDSVKNELRSLKKTLKKSGKKGSCGFGKRRRPQPAPRPQKSSPASRTSSSSEPTDPIDDDALRRPMRRLKFVPGNANEIESSSTTQLPRVEAKNIKISDDGDFLEF